MFNLFDINADLKANNEAPMGKPLAKASREAGNTPKKDRTFSQTLEAPSHGANPVSHSASSRPSAGNAANGFAPSNRMESNRMEPVVAPLARQTAVVDEAARSEESLAIGEQNLASDPAIANLSSNLNVNKKLAKDSFALLTEIMPSPELKDWARLIMAFEPQVAESPVLQVLTGAARGLSNQNLTAIIASSPKLQNLLGEDSAQWLEKPQAFEELVDLFEVSSETIERGLSLGLNPDLNVSPKVFLKSLGVDPHKVLYEIDAIKERLGSLQDIAGLGAASALKTPLQKPKILAKTPQLGDVQPQDASLPLTSSAPQSLGKTQSPLAVPMGNQADSRLMAQAPTINDFSALSKQQSQAMGVSPEAALSGLKANARPEANIFAEADGSALPKDLFSVKELVQNLAFAKDVDLPEGLKVDLSQGEANFGMIPQNAIGGVSNESIDLSAQRFRGFEPKTEMTQQQENALARDEKMRFKAEEGAPFDTDLQKSLTPAKATLKPEVKAAKSLDSWMQSQRFGAAPILTEEAVAAFGEKDAEDSEFNSEGESAFANGEHVIPHAAPSNKASENLQASFAKTASSVDRQNLMEQVVQKARELVKQGPKQATLEFSENGKNDAAIRISVHGEQVRLSVIRGSESLRDHIAREMNQLSEALIDKNLRLVDIDLGHDRQRNPFASQDFQGQRQSFEQNQEQAKFASTMNSDMAPKRMAQEKWNFNTKKPMTYAPNSRHIQVHA